MIGKISAGVAPRLSSKVDEQPSQRVPGGDLLRPGRVRPPRSVGVFGRCVEGEPGTQSAADRGPGSPPSDAAEGALCAGPRQPARQLDTHDAAELNLVGARRPALGRAPTDEVARRPMLAGKTSRGRAVSELSSLHGCGARPSDGATVMANTSPLCPLSGWSLVRLVRMASAYRQATKSLLYEANYREAKLIYLWPRHGQASGSTGAHRDR